MEDGRTFTSYITDSVNTMIMKQEMVLKIMKNIDNFSIENADAIMKQNKVMFESQSYVYESPDNNPFNEMTIHHIFLQVLMTKANRMDMKQMLSRTNT